MIIKFVQQFHILSDKPGQGGILVSNPPPLENDDGYQHQYNDDDGGCQDYGDNHGKIHTLCSLNPEAKVCKEGRSIVPLLQIIVPILQKNNYYPRFAFEGKYP